MGMTQTILQFYHDRSLRATRLYIGSSSQCLAVDNTGQPTRLCFFVGNPLQTHSFFCNQEPPFMRHCRSCSLALAALGLFCCFLPLWFSQVILGFSCVLHAQTFE